MKQLLVITALSSTLALAGSLAAGNTDVPPLPSNTPSMDFSIPPEVTNKGRFEYLLLKLEDSDPFVRVEAVQDLGELPGEMSLVAVSKCLQDENMYVRAYAAEALGKIGKLGPSLAVSGLLSVLHDSSAYVRAMAASALGELQDQRAIAPLRKLLDDDDKSVRRMATWALGKIEPRR
jgi:HEAT repeat protein